MSNPVSSRIPDAVAPLADVMASFAAPWALCGGWAVDAWLGRVTRDHGDIDISVFVQDQRLLHEHLRGWQLLAHDPAWIPGGADEWWKPERNLGPTTHIHARGPEWSGAMPKDGIALDNDGFKQEFYLDDRDGDEWVLLRDPLIRVPLRDAVVECPWGIPAVAPEVLLFFKSRDLRRRDKLDFAALLPQLSTERRTWLREAIDRMGHPWMAELSREPVPAVAP